ncbi:MAG TPA: hypothetical protein VKE74_17695, partial [Gemmataceae bacterium]|nr:hypothetical protein [Gemmataceae bacterium]
MSTASIIDRARERTAQQQRQQEQDRAERERRADHRTALERFRPGWTAAWSELLALVSPVWANNSPPDWQPDPERIAAALMRVGEVFCEHDRINAPYLPSIPVLPGNPPRSGVGRLEWFAEHSGCDPDALAIIAVRFVLAGLDTDAE